jgi:hypothetical protein
MSVESQRKNLVEVKTALVRKWESRAKNANSRPLKAKLERLVAKYRRQVQDLSR